MLVETVEGRGFIPSNLTILLGGFPWLTVCQDCIDPLFHIVTDVLDLLHDAEVPSHDYWLFLDQKGFKRKVLSNMASGMILLEALGERLEPFN